MKNQLAIIIPYYKITFFDECLRSLASQTNKNFNVYIGNDNSPNDPLDIVNKYADTLSITYKKFTDNVGGNNLVKQWDRCIDLSKDEEWIMILGDDDTLDNNVVTEFYNILPKARNIELIRLASQEINEINEPRTKVYYNPELESAKDYFFRCQYDDLRCTLTEHFFTKKSYKKNGFKNFPVAFGSDIVAWLEFPELGNVIGINNAIANIRISSENLSSIQDRQLGFKRVEGYYRYYRYIVQKFNKKFSIDENEFILNKAYFYFRIFNRNNFDVVEFILFMSNKIGLVRTFHIIKNNRNRK